MENEEIRQYLIDFVVKTLSECDAFSKVYGKEFIEGQLNKNVEKVITDVFSKRKVKGAYNPTIKAIILLSENENSPPMTIQDIEGNRILKHNILHEALHAIFELNKEEHENKGLKYGTGLDEVYLDGKQVGIGINEGLTEWICQKAGYGCVSYFTECNIVRLLELAIGEENVMRLAQGNINGSAEQLLGLERDEYLYVLSLIDRIHDNEIEAFSVEDGIDNKPQLEKLDKSISHFEATIFEKYFKEEIEDAIKSDTVSMEIDRRMAQIQMLIQGGETSASDIFSSRLPIRFKREIYPQLSNKYYQNLRQEMIEKRKLNDEVDTRQLPVVYKKTWFSRFKNYINNKFIKKKEKIANQPECSDTPDKSFKKYISDMSNYSKNDAEEMDMSEQYHPKTIYNYDEIENCK